MVQTGRHFVLGERLTMRFKLNIVVQRPNHGGSARVVIYEKFEESSVPQGIDTAKAIVAKKEEELAATGGEIISAKAHLVQLVWTYRKERKERG
jgi:hypothetical protein